MLTNIRAHSNRVEHEVNLATELLLSLSENLFQILNAGRIRCDDRSVDLFSELIQRTPYAKP